MKTLTHTFLKTMSALLIMALCLPLSVVFATDATGRNIRVFSVEGNNATITRSGITANATANLRLGEGNSLTTGHGSHIFLQLDSDSLLKMDQNSEVTVGSTRNLLSLNLVQGYALVHAATQAPDHEMEIRIGARGLTVRGTLFTMGQNPHTGTITVVMLSGAGEMGNIWLDAGDMLIIEPDPLGNDHYEIIRGFDASQLNYFSLVALASHSEYLLTQENPYATPELIRTAGDILLTATREAIDGLPAPAITTTEIASALPTSVVSGNQNSFQVEDSSFTLVILHILNIALVLVVISLIVFIIRRKRKV